MTVDGDLPTGGLLAADTGMGAVTLRVADLLALLAAAADEPLGELTERVLPLLRRLVAQGYLTA